MNWTTGVTTGAEMASEFNALPVDPNTVVCTQASDFSGTLDSTKLYIVSGIIDFTGTGINIEIPSGGLSMAGSSFDLSGLICTDDNYTLFTSPAGGSGNLTKRDFYCTTSGSNSQVYALTSATNFDAFEIARINWNSCTSLGYLDGFRQGVETGTGRFGGKPELEFRGAWAGGYFINTSIVRSITDGAYTLFKAGTGFIMQSRFRTDMNADLNATVSLFDFSASNFPNINTVQLLGMLVARNGVFDASDSTLTPNIGHSELPCIWKGNTGIRNTNVGGRVRIITEAATTLTHNVWSNISGTFSLSAAAHFDSPASGELRHLGPNPIDFNFYVQVIFSGSNGNDIEVRVQRWNDSASTWISFTEFYPQRISVGGGGNNTAQFINTSSILLEKNDKVRLQVRNTTTGNPVTMLQQSSIATTEK